MRVVELRDRARLARFLCRNPGLHIYALGDLDDFFWPHTRWFGLHDEERLQEVALLYTGARPATLLAFCADAPEPMRRLLAGIASDLPSSLYAHLSPGLAAALRARFALRAHGRHLKLVLREPGALEGIDTGGSVRLGPGDLEELQTLYLESYPGNWFDPRMLETGYYFGIRQGGRMRSVAGIHVVSATRRVAALGNVTTHPDARGRGLATACCAALCQALLPAADWVGANVQADNGAALALYQRLGFQAIAPYEEYDLQPLR